MGHYYVLYVVVSKFGTPCQYTIILKQSWFNETISTLESYCDLSTHLHLNPRLANTTSNCSNTIHFGCSTQQMTLLFYCAPPPCWQHFYLEKIFSFI